MINLRNALFAEIDDLDPEAFCLMGRTMPLRRGAGKAGQDDPGDHIVNVLCAQVDRDGEFDLKALQKTAEEWIAAGKLAENAESQG